MGINAVCLLFHLFRFQYERYETTYTGIQLIHRQTAIFKCGSHFCGILLCRSRHLKIKSGPEGLNTVTHGTPVCHDETIKAPLLTQDISEQPSVYSGIDIVDPVI